MKQALLLITLFIMLAGCGGKTTTGQSDTTAVADTLNYPFKPKYGINWVRGDEKNALIVLNSLKKYVDGDVKGALENFADTVVFTTDNFYYKGTRDSLAPILIKGRAEFATVTKEFETWLTIYYPEKKDTWVTLLYTEKWTDKAGKSDSLNYIDDVLLKDGKIVKYQENVRHYVGK
ncbi:MAG: hypothetical protein ABIN95_09340 [Mucilaginibacter sp.]